jgi:sporulation protein YlmC with PRC-barrel domain
MANAETFNQQSQNGPQILELLSELEKRDKGSKGGVQSGSLVGAGFGNPTGYTVQNATGNDVGKVADLYVDPHTRRPHYALLSLGGHVFGIGARNILVGYDDIEVTGEKQVRVRTALPVEYIGVVETVTIVAE